MMSKHTCFTHTPGAPPVFIILLIWQCITPRIPGNTTYTLHIRADGHVAEYTRQKSLYTHIINILLYIIIIIIISLGNEDMHRLVRVVIIIYYNDNTRTAGVQQAELDVPTKRIIFLCKRRTRRHRREQI